MLDAQSRRRTAIVASLLLIAAATLVPKGGAWLRDFWCWRCGGDAGTIELALNVLLFVPLGLALARPARVSRAVLAIAATTLTVELLQYFVVVGRHGALRDAVANFGGGVAGLLVAPHLWSLWRPDARTARRVAWSAAAFWITHAIFAMIAFRPSMTRHPLFAQLAPHLGQYDIFGATVPHAAVNGATVFDGEFPAGITAESWQNTPLELTAATTSAPPTERLAPVFSLVDSRAIEIAALAEKRGDLVFRSRTLADDFGLRVPVLVIGSVFTPRGVAPSPIRLTGYRDRFTLTASAVHAGGERQVASVTLKPSFGWSLWWPFDVPGPATIAWMTWVWLALPVGAIAFWSASSATKPRDWISLLPAGVAVVVAHVLVPRLFGIAPFGVRSESRALAIGLLIGLALGASRKSGSPA